MVATATHSFSPIFFRLFGLLFYFVFLSLHFNLHSYHIILVEVNLLGIFQILFVLLHPLLSIWTFNRVYFSVFAQMAILICISLFLGLPAFLFLLLCLDKFFHVGYPLPLVVVCLLN